MIISTRFGNVPQLHLVSMAMGVRKQITFFEDPLGNAIYEPENGNYFLFTKDIGGNEFGQIFRYDMADGKVTMLTDGGRSQNGGIVWNRLKNNGHILYSSTKGNGTDRDFYMMDPLHPEKEFMFMQNKGGGWGISDWAGDFVLITQSISANESRLWLYLMGPEPKMLLTDTTEKSVWYGQPRLVNAAKKMYFITDKGSEFKRLASMDLITRRITYLTTIPWDIEGYDITKDEKKVVFVTNEAGESKMYILNTADGSYKPVVSLPSGVYSNPTIHQNGRDVSVSINSARSATDIYVLDLLSGKSERWTESELGGLVAAELPVPKTIHWKSFDGLDISGFYYPAAKRFEGKRPVIINIHGGPEGQSRPVFQGANNYFMNEMGAVMIYPNVRGSTGYGKTFLAMDNGMKREESVKDIGALLDWIEKQPELDASRIMVTGGSYGGYMTLAVATHYNDRIRCGLDVVGISNFNTFLKNTEGYRRDLRRVEYGDERDSAMHTFLETISPLNNAYKITKPLFIVQGGNDPRVPRTEAEQMAKKVRENGSTVWYLEASDEGHGFRKKNNADFQRLATILFIRQFLL
jgi:dienelactone hydrolase